MTSLTCMHSYRTFFVIKIYEKSFSKNRKVEKFNTIVSVKEVLYECIRIRLVMPFTYIKLLLNNVYSL